jgi:glutamyl-tRNA reductase
MRTTNGIFCVGVDHHTTPLASRELLAALAGERLTPHLIEHEGAEEVVFLSTCNRVEIYGHSSRRGPEIAVALGRAMPFDLAKTWKTTQGLYLHEGLACWRHLSEVATGLRSMVMGEAEILGQVRSAYQSSRELGGTGKAMHGLFQSALRAARAARQAAGFGKGDPSVGKCAAEALAELLGEREVGPLLLLGAGHTARSFGLAAMEQGFRKIWISSRTKQRAEALAKDLGGEAVSWDRWGEAVRASGVLVSALSGGELPWKAPLRKGGPVALVDLGVPRTLTQVRTFYREALWLDLEELAKRSEFVPESIGAIHRAEEVLRGHERMWLTNGTRAVGTFPGSGG